MNTVNVKPVVTEHILAVIREKAKNPISSGDMIQTVKLEHLMMRHYLDNPGAFYGGCREAVQPLIPELRLDDQTIRRRAEGMRLSERTVRAELAAWVKDVCALLYAGMGGDRKAIAEAEKKLTSPYRDDLRSMHPAQSELVLNGLFCTVPELKDTPERDEIFKLGRRYSRAALSGIVNSITYDIGIEDDPLAGLTREELEREVYLARRELCEYRALVEAADREFEDKLRERSQQEVQSFFAALNNEKYGFLIDSLYLNKRACMEARLSGEQIPYSMQGVPVTIDRLLTFLRDSGVAPASRFTPHSTYSLRLSDMDGCRFEPSPERKTPIAPGERVTVKVLSAGWKKGDVVFAYPVLQEE